MNWGLNHRFANPGNFRGSNPLSAICMFKGSIPAVITLTEDNVDYDSLNKY